MGRTPAIQPGSRREKTLIGRFGRKTDEEIAVLYGWSVQTSRNYRERLAPNSSPKKKTPTAGTDRGISTNPEGLDLVADKHPHSSTSAPIQNNG